MDGLADSINSIPFLPYEGSEPYIFVSYSHRDKERVLPILTALHERSYRVWYDLGIYGGSPWPEAIADHIERCSIFLPFYSNAFNDSRWCNYELHYAMSHMKNPIQVYLEDVDLNRGIRIQVSRIHYLRYTDYGTPEDFINQLERNPELVQCRGGTGDPETSSRPTNWEEEASALRIALLNEKQNTREQLIAQRKAMKEWLSRYAVDLMAQEESDRLKAERRVQQEEVRQRESERKAQEEMERHFMDRVAEERHRLEKEQKILEEAERIKKTAERRVEREKAWEAEAARSRAVLFKEKDKLSFQMQMKRYLQEKEVRIEKMSQYHHYLSGVCGDTFTLCLLWDGTVTAAGWNQKCRDKIADWHNMVAISAGAKHAVGLRQDGTVEIVCGEDSDDYWDCRYWSNIAAVSAGRWHTVGLRLDGTVVAEGSNYYDQCNVTEWQNIIAISAGSHHTVGLRSDGAVEAVGHNLYNQCNVTSWRSIKAISAGGWHTVGLRSDGTVVAVGSNGNGECNVSGWENIIAVSAGSGYTVGLRSNGRVVATGSYHGSVSHWQNIVEISAGEEHIVGLQKKGTLVATGSNRYGQCYLS